jgi:tRNA modification GTPase
LHAETTIAAISSPPGAARRGVIRISGPATARILAASCWTDAGPLAVAKRSARAARFDDGIGEQPALVLWMPAPHSFTREDVAELHLPGAPLLLDRALRRVLDLGAEAAQPGEFTRRAFLNGRIDLTRAEGVLALVSARNEEQQRAATALLFGGLGERMDQLRDSLDALRALCEASLDFDESDTGHVPTAELAQALAEVRIGLDEALAFEERRTIHEGQPRLALVGAPNAGKSSLFNRLVSSEKAMDRALVSGAAGTTRDAKAAFWTVAGVQCRLLDTAGLVEVSGGTGGARDLEHAAQDVTARETRAADLWLWVVDATSGVDHVGAEPWRRIQDGSGASVLLIWNKVDLPGAVRPPVPDAAHALGSVSVSARTGAGVDELAALVASALGLGAGAGEGHGGVGRELHVRHRDALVRAAREVDVAARGLDQQAPLDLVAEAMRAATDELDRISGRTTPEGLLDRIFARFCLGK